MFKGLSFKNGNVFSDDYICKKHKMMATKIRFLLLILSFILFSLPVKSQNDIKSDTLVLIKTRFGNMKVRLYDETPLHRKNFLKLVREGFYNELLFHRVIKDFMIQGGDPESKNAKPNKMLGDGDLGYEIPAEFNPALFHKKGALAAARTPDDVNPEKKSSASQFYIVQGKIWTDDELQQLQEKKKNYLINQEGSKLMKTYKPALNRLHREGKKDSLDLMIKSIQLEAEKKAEDSLFPIDSLKRAVYTTIGGTPHLDGAYTVFGEVVEGMNVIDSIANVKTDRNDRPLDDVKMQMEIIIAE